MVAVSRLETRVNLRIDQDTYDAYEKVASFFNRSVPSLMRDALQQSTEIMQGLGAMIDQAKAGDAEAVQRLFTAMMQMSQGHLDMVRETAAAEFGQLGEGTTDAGRASNTSR